jgi:hypothetical protein
MARSPLSLPAGSGTLWSFSTGAGDVAPRSGILELPQSLVDCPLWNATAGGAADAGRRATVIEVRVVRSLITPVAKV